MVTGTTWLTTPLPAPITGRATTGQDEPVSPVETKMVLPSTAACRVISVSEASELLPSPSATGRLGLASAWPTSGLITGMVSHSP